MSSRLPRFSFFVSLLMENKGKFWFTCSVLYVAVCIVKVRWASLEGNTPILYSILTKQPLFRSLLFAEHSLLWLLCAKLFALIVSTLSPLLL